MVNFDDQNGTLKNPWSIRKDIKHAREKENQLNKLKKKTPNYILTITQVFGIYGTNWEKRSESANLSFLSHAHKTTLTMSID